MRKILFALTCVLLVSCSKNDVDNTPEPVANDINVKLQTITISNGLSSLIFKKHVQYDTQGRIVKVTDTDSRDTISRITNVNYGNNEIITTEPTTSTNNKYTYIFRFILNADGLTTQKILYVSSEYPSQKTEIFDTTSFEYGSNKLISKSSNSRSETYISFMGPTPETTFRRNKQSRTYINDGKLIKSFVGETDYSTTFSTATTVSKTHTLAMDTATFSYLKNYKNITDYSNPALFADRLKVAIDLDFLNKNYASVPDKMHFKRMEKDDNGNTRVTIDDDINYEITYDGNGIISSVKQIKTNGNTIYEFTYK